MLRIKMPRSERRDAEVVVPALRWGAAARRLLIGAAAFAAAGGGLSLLLARGQPPATVPALLLAAGTLGAGLWLCRTLGRLRTPVRLKINHGYLDVTSPGTFGIFGPRLRRIPVATVRDVSVAGDRLRVHVQHRPTIKVARSSEPAELERAAAALRSALNLDDGGGGARRRSRTAHAVML